MNEREALKLALDTLERCVATCFDQYSHEQVMSQPDHFINQTITAIKEVLTQPEQDQEPVAWMDEFGNVFLLHAQRGPKYLNEPMKPLYTTPPQRTWVGLTDEERGQAINANVGTGLWAMAAAIEAALKEKNT